MKKSDTKGTLRKVLNYIGAHKALLALSILFAAASVALTLWIPLLIGRAIDCIIDAGRVDFALLKGYLIKVAMAALATALLQWLMDTVNNKITYEVVRDVREDAFRRIEQLPLAYIDSHPHGETVSRIIADVDQFADGLLMGVTQLFTGAATILGALLFMLMLYPVIAAVVVVMTPISLFVAKFIASHSRDMFRAQSETRGEMTGFIDEMINNQNVVHAFDHENQTMADFDAINDRLSKFSLRATFFSSLTNPGTRFVNNIVYAVVALVGAFAAINGSITAGILASFLSYVNQYTKPFNEISGVITEFQNALTCAGRIFDLIEQPAQPSDAHCEELKNVRGRIALKDVSFSYVPEVSLIEHLNLQVDSGKRVAIVGPTGCGKTTFINLLMRFYDVNDGSISVDHKDIRRVTRNSLRRHYGMVLQDTWLKNGTVKENISLGKPDATDAEIIAAAKASHAHSFIKRLPKGYNTVIDENGGSLSQGQKQLLCIARVMLCLPPMLILDEATSSIDTCTELKIQDAFARLMKGRTSFIVAHRLSTIRDADVILVMKDGHIVEQGDHASLLQKGGAYAKLYYSQFEGIQC